MVVPDAEWLALQNAIAGVVARPGTGRYDAGTRPFNARFHELRPQAIVACTTPADVAETLSFVARHGLANVARSGGHCFAGHSSGRGVVIDVGPMDSVEVDRDQAVVGTGARLGNLYDRLQDHEVTIPAGTCPDVGIAGLTLGGGLGILGRRYGVTSDRLVGAQVVLADGRVVGCDEERHADLFWALRGAGAGNFGVVTSLRFRVVPVPEVTNIHLVWPDDEAVAAVRAWQELAPHAPDELYASVKLTTTADADRPALVEVYGAYTGTGAEPDARHLVDELVSRVGTEPVVVTVEPMSFQDSRRFWAELPTGHEQSAEPAEPQQPYFLCKSEFFALPLPAEALTALVETFRQDRPSGQVRELDFMPWGGAYNRVPAAATAFVHRNELFQLKHSAVVDPRAATGEKRAARQWVARSWTTVHPWGSGRVFPNFPDPDLEDSAQAYYGTNYPRLLEIKARHDPDGLFRFPQSLPVLRRA